MPTPKRKFWQFKNQTEQSAELYLYGDISDSSWWGDEVTPKQFSEELSALGNVSEITVRINSGGGDVFAATAIGNLLEQNAATVTAKIDGICASAATIIACHCSKVIAANDSTYMIHPVKMGICGYVDAETMQQYIDAIKAIRENIISLYAKKTGRDKDEVAAQMDATSWWTGAEAKENGFVDELINDDGETIIENRNGLLFVNSIGTSLNFSEAPDFVQNNLTTSPAVSCCVKNTGKAETPRTSNKEEKDMEINTVDDLRTAYPELVNEIETAAAENATNAERQRIHDIEDMCIPGFEASANEAKFLKPVSAADYAMAAVKNAKQSEEAKKKAFLNGTAKDAANSGADGVNQEQPNNNVDDEFLNAIKAAGKKA